jgi:hypothetical protein
MSIPVTASTEAFTPACLQEIEGAPTFTFRHATVLDKQQFHRVAIAEGLMRHDDAAVREVTIAELRELFEGDGIEENVTQLQAYWQAIDEFGQAQAIYRQQCIEILRAAGEDEQVELPPEPELEFPADRAKLLDEMMQEVRRHSRRLTVMLADNVDYSTRFPRILLRMFLTGTSLPVQVKRRDKIITELCCEEIIEALSEFAASHDVDEEDAVSELLTKAMLSFALRKDEEKNSSSPLSGITSPERSAKKPSASTSTETSTKSNDPATGDEANGSNSSESECPVSQ